MSVASFHPPADQLLRVPISLLNPKTFMQQFDAPCQPVMLTGALSDWPVDSWNLEQLSKQHGDCLFKASKPSGGKLLMSLNDYLAYMACQHDEEPLYIFDSSFGTKVPYLLELYNVPSVFGPDLMELLGKRVSGCLVSSSHNRR
eukprot:jgi/Chrzof1/323/Cz01g11120.t1